VTAFPALRARAGVPVGWALTAADECDPGGDLWRFAIPFLARLAAAADAARTIAPDLTMRGNVRPCLRGSSCRMEWQVGPGTVRLTGPGGAVVQLSRS